MFELTPLVKIGAIELDFVVSVTIDKSWQTLTDTAEIRLPRRSIINGKLHNWQSTDDDGSMIKKGDKVKVQLGYDFNYYTEFEGFVTEIIPEIPVIIKCEDLTYKFKENSFTHSFKDTTVKEVINLIAPNATNIIDLSIGDYRINRKSTAWVLDDFRKKFGIYSYVKNGALNVGYPYSSPNPIQVRLKYGYNVVKSGFKFVRSDDFKIKVRAVSIFTDGSKFEKTVGDENGVERTLHFTNVPEGELESLAEEHLLYFKFDGLTGDITCFGQPVFEHGDIADIINDEYPEQSGAYFIDKVKVRFEKGYRRIATIGLRA